MWHTLDWAWRKPVQKTNAQNWRARKLSQGESDEGSEMSKSVKEARHPSRQSSKDSNTADSISPNGPLSPSARSSCMSPVFKDLLAQKVAERQTRVNGAGTPAEETPPTPLPQTMAAPPAPPPPAPVKQPEPSTPISEAPTAAPGASNGSTNGNGSLPHSFSVEEIQKVSIIWDKLAF